MKIYVIEDNTVYNEYVCNLLKKGGFKTEQAYHLNTAKKLLTKIGDDDIVLADLRLPEGDSIELLRWMRKNEMRHPFIVMTNYGEVGSAVESMKLGSKDYIQKPLLEDKLLPLIRSIQEERDRLAQRQVPIFIRQGAAYQNIKKRVRLVAATRMSVLILGESISRNTSMPKANCLTNLSLRWIAGRYLRHWRNPLSSGISRGHLPELIPIKPGISKKPKAERYSLTKSVT